MATGLSEPELSRVRTARTFDAIYSPPRKSAKRRRCDGHMAAPHHIEKGELLVWSALPPGSEHGNEGWWHSVFCLDCAPITPSRPEGAKTGETDGNLPL